MVAKGGPGAGAAAVKLFEKGDVVEVGSDEEGFKDAWYVAVVIDTPSTTTTTNTNTPPSKKKSKNHSDTTSDKYLIEYKTLLDDDGKTPLKEHVRAEFVRPLPPLPSKADLAHQFSAFEVVDAFSRDGWWTGVITRILDHNTFVVAFQNPPDVVEFKASDLRVHRSWIDGQWVRPENQRGTSKSVFRRGMEVEVSFENDDYRDVWFPATVLEDMGNESFMAKYQTMGNGKTKIYLKGIADLQHIRPSPIFPNERKFVLLEKVDAFYNFSWWSGVVTKELPGRRYIVYFKRKIKEMEFHHSDLRPHIEWKNEVWTASSSDIVIRSSYQLQTESHCIPAVDSKISADHTSFGVKKGNSVEKTPPLDHEKKQTLESTPCNGKPTSSGMASVRKITSPKTPSIDASQSWPSKKVQGDAPHTPSLETCELNTAVKEIPTKENLSFSSPSVASTKSSRLQHSAGGDQLSTKSRSGSLMKSRNDNSVSRKRGRPPKSLLIDEGASLVDEGVSPTGSGSATRANPPRLKRAANQTIETHPVKKLKSPIAKKAQPPNTELEEPSLNRVGIDSSGLENVSSVQDPQQAPSGKRGKASEKRSMAEGTKDATDEVPNRESDNQALSSRFEGMHSPEEAVDDSRSSPKRNLQQCSSKTKTKAVVENPMLNTAAAAAGGGSVLASNQSVAAFARTSPLWQMIDGMEVFKVMPQNPHFGPLKSSKESCREGLAIGCMVTFASVVKKISEELHFDDPRSSIEESLETIRELESQGFDVKMVVERLKGLLEIKEKHKVLGARSEQLQVEIVERGGEKTKNDQEIEVIDKQIKELQEKRVLAMSKKAAKDSEIASLKSSAESVEQGMRSMHEDFIKLATAPWPGPIDDHV